MKLYIKYMVSHRCEMVVKAEFEKLGFYYVTVNLGVVEISKEISSEERELLKINLSKVGLELMEDKRSMLIEEIKEVILDMIQSSGEALSVNYSDHIGSKLNYDYTYLSNVFSESQGITIQQFIINHKIERVKELLLEGKLSLTEISYKLNYSSVAHLSNQFKKYTGLTPSVYKQLLDERGSSKNV